MKLADMADLLEGLRGALEKFLGKGALNDLTSVSECFRRFGDESVGAFCNYIVATKEGKPKGRTAAALDAAAVEHHVREIQRLLDDRHSQDYAAVDRVIDAIGRLKVPEIKAVGAGIGCPLSGAKPAMLSRLKSWINNIKRSAHQSSFTLESASAPEPVPAPVP